MRLSEMGGMLVGLLDADELTLFEMAVQDGRAYRSYEGASGFMGLAKVKLVEAAQTAGEG